MNSAAGIAIWVFLGGMWAASLAFAIRRRKLPQRAQWKAVRARMPFWLKLSEGAAILFFWLAYWVALSVPLTLLTALAHEGRADNDGNALLLVLAAGFVACAIPAMLTANLIARAVPALRQANELALAGQSAVSFESANRELLRLGAFVTPYCLAFSLWGAFEPWRF